jgi:hypothetical protein
MDYNQVCHSFESLGLQGMTWRVWVNLTERGEGAFLFALMTAVVLSCFGWARPKNRVDAVLVVCVCVCVCVTQREKKRIQKEREIQKIGKRRESERHTERETLSVLYFVCVGGSDLSAMQEFAMTLTHRVSFSP